MKPVSLPGRPGRDATIAAKVDWLMAAVDKLALASRTADPNQMADAYTTSHVTTTRTLDVSTATLADVANVLGTVLQDMHRRGIHRGTG